MFLTAESKRVLNSLTKYPKIPTYHRRDGKGIISDDVISVQYRSNEVVYVHEKIDGENTRITILPTGEYLIGSRDEWLTISGDRMWNEKDGLVDILRPFAERALQVPNIVKGDKITTFFCEVYGHKASDKWKNYGDGTPGVRLFDVATVPADMLDIDIEVIARWRENRPWHRDVIWDDQGGLDFMSMMAGFTEVPSLGSVSGSDVPTSLADMHEFIKQWPSTSAAIVGEGGPSEGVVLSDAFRKRLTKVKFRDYERVEAIQAEEKRLMDKAIQKAARAVAAFEAGRRGE